MENLFNQRTEIVKKLDEIEELEEEFDECHSYTRSMLLESVWKECKGLGEKYNNSFLINVAKEKISLYSEFIDGKVSKERVKESIKPKVYYLLDSVEKVASAVRNRKNELRNNFISKKFIN